MTPPVELQRTEAPAIRSETVVVVSEALLPLLCWREVPVLREVRQELTQLERFLLEMALKLGTVKDNEFEEVVSLPRNVLAGGMSRLVAGGALQLVGGEFHVVSEVAARFLEQEAVIREVKSTADFAFLPRSGDLLAVSAGKGGSWLRELDIQQPAPAANAPVPRDLWGQTRNAYLAKRVDERTVAGSERDVTAVCEPDDARPLVPPTGKPNKTDSGGAGTRPAVCEAYRCHAEVRRGASGEYTVHAFVKGESKRDRKGSGNRGDQDEMAVVKVNLPGAVGLLDSWLELTGALDDPTTMRAAWRKIGPPPTSYDGVPLARQKSPAEWEFLLNGLAAHAIAEQGRILTQPVGLAIKGEEAVVELLCRFAPGDEDAQTLFARDLAAAIVLSSDDPARELDAACHEAGGLASPTHHLSPEAVRERIWQLGWYRLAYALREWEDFPYD